MWISIQTSKTKAYKSIIHRHNTEDFLNISTNETSSVGDRKNKRKASPGKGHKKNYNY